MPRGPRIDLDVQDEIRKLALDEAAPATPAQIFRHLERETKFEGRVPELRAIQRFVKKLAPPDPSGEWSFVDAEPEDARLVLDVLAEITARTNGQARITCATAEWIIKIRKAAPSISPLEAYQFAKEYRAREDRRIDTRDLDLMLAFAPWESDDARKVYDSMVYSGVTKDWGWLTMFRQVRRKEAGQE